MDRSASDIGVLKGDFDEYGNSLFFKKYLDKYQIKPYGSVLIDDSEDKDGRIKNAGINYLRIKPLVGLIPAIKSLG